MVSKVVKPKSTPVEILKFIQDYGFAINICVALRILLTLSVTVASKKNELKLIKTSLRLSMSATRLSGLATISIEYKVSVS